MSETKPAPSPSSPPSSPRIGRTWVRVALATVSFVIVLVGASLAVRPVVNAMGMTGLAGRLLSSGTAAAAIVLLAVCWWRLVDRRPGRALGLRVSPVALPQFVLGTLLAGAAVVGGALLAAAAGWVRFTPAIQPSAWLMAVPATLVAAFIAQGLPEEVFFRGYVYGTTDRLRPAVRIATTSISFGAIHIISNSAATSWAERLLYVVMACAFGFACTALRGCTDTVWIAVGAHGGFHLGHFATVLFLTPVAPPGMWLGWIVGLLTLGAVALMVATRQRRTAADRRMSVV